MSTMAFKDILTERFGYHYDSQVERSPLLLTTDYDDNPNLHPKQLIYLEFAKTLSADAVLFRYFDEGDNRFCIPQIYIYDNSDTRYNAQRIAEFHRNVYSSCQVPMMMVIGRAEVTMYDVRKPVEVREDATLTNQSCEVQSLSRQLNDANLAMKLFKEINNTGVFWDFEDNKSDFLENKSAYRNLLDGLRVLRKLFLSDAAKSFPGKDVIDIEHLVNKIFVYFILIKYLEENGYDDAYKCNYMNGFINDTTGCESLQEVVSRNQLILFLNELEKHFNGGVFKMTSAEVDLLSCSTSLEWVLTFLDGRLDGQGSATLWAYYSFKYIPIELISNFYEEFLIKEESVGAVYTPSFLVNTIIDDILPLSKTELNSNVMLLDPSCGSGIFLATAFKRLVQRWRIENGKDGKLADTNVYDVKKILCRNIHGVDINSMAVNLTIFSLQLALVQCLTPRKVWTPNLFADLKENIIHIDFFDFEKNVKNHNRFDLIVGNPPFERLDVKDSKHKIILSKVSKCKYPNPKKELALYFLELSPYLLASNGILALIIPSGPLLLQESSFEFRKAIFQKKNVFQVFDLTFTRRTLFSSGMGNDITVPVSVIFLDNNLNGNETINHIVFRRTVPSKGKQFFEIDYYDFHEVTKEEAINNPHVWKTNLLGGGRLHLLVGKLKKMPKLEDNYVKNAGRSKVEKRIYIETKLTHGNFPFVLDVNKSGTVSLPLALDKVDEVKAYLINEQNKAVFNAYIAATSGRQGVRGAYTLDIKDINQLPYCNGVIHISNLERIIAEDIMNYRISEFGKGELAEINSIIQTNNAIPHELWGYAKVYTEMLNVIYKKPEENLALRLTEVISGNGFFALQFEFTKNDCDSIWEENDDKLDELLEKELGRNIIVKRVTRLYNGDNRICLVKPKQLRYWLRSIAIRDADDTFTDLINAGY